MNLKKIISAVMLIVTVSCMLCACQQSGIQKETASDSEVPELKIGVDDLKPFFYTDENGDYAGIDADIATEACSRAGYKPDFVKISWADRESCLKDGSVDCIWNAFIKNGREDSYHWTDTYMQSDLRIITGAKSPDKDIASIGENVGIAVRAGSKIEELLWKNNENGSPVQIYLCGTIEMAETAFVKGYVGALGGHEEVLREIINSYPGQYHFLDGSLMTADLAVAFYKDDISDKYSKINDALKSMEADGTITEIIEKYNYDLTVTEEVSADEEE